MDMSVTEGSIWQRIFSDKGFTSISHYFVMDWVSVWLDIALGLVIAGALAAWVSNDFWQAFFLTDHPIWSKLWGPIVGPIVAIFSFVFGYGQELYFWTFIVAILIFAIGGGMSIYEGYEGITHLINPSPLEDPMWNYIVLGIAILLEGYSWTVALKEFLPTKGKQNFWQAIKNSKDPTVITILFEDTAAILGLLVALIGIFLGHLFNNVYFDGIASIIIGIILAIVAVVLARESKGLLVGESADPQTIANIRSLSKTEPGVKEVIRVLTMQLAPKEVLLNLELQFSHNLTGEEIALTVESLEASIRQKHPEIKQIFIEAKSLTAARRTSQTSQ